MRISDWSSDVCSSDLLRREDDARILLAQRFQPFAQLRGEGGAVEDKPALVDDDQGRRAIEPLPDAVKEIGEHGGGRGGADEPLGLERLHTRVAEAFDLRVEEASPGRSEEHTSELQSPMRISS